MGIVVLSAQDDRALPCWWKKQGHYYPFIIISSISVLCHFSDAGGEEESSQQPQQVASALVNSSPKMPRVEAPNATQPALSSRPERFDVTLHRKDNEGFGFVILTSKNKPPPGGQKQIYIIMHYFHPLRSQNKVKKTHFNLLSHYLEALCFQSLNIKMSVIGYWRFFEDLVLACLWERSGSSVPYPKTLVQFRFRLIIGLQCIWKYCNRDLSTKNICTPQDDTKILRWSSKLFMWCHTWVVCGHHFGPQHIR